MSGIFGINGIRGVANQDITPEFATAFGSAVGTWIGEGGTVITGRDTRTTARMMKRAFTTGLMSTGVDIVDFRVSPVPVIQYLTSKFGADCSSSITASHNPPNYIGLKIFNSDGLEISEKEQKEISDIYMKKKFKRVDWRDVGEIVYL